jgi:hypothetical protein
VQISVPLDSAEGLEAAARTRRYAVFADIDADWLVLGLQRNAGDVTKSLAKRLPFRRVPGLGEVQTTNLARSPTGLTVRVAHHLRVTLLR